MALYSIRRQFVISATLFGTIWLLFIYLTFKIDLSTENNKLAWKAAYRKKIKNVSSNPKPSDKLFPSRNVKDKHVVEQQENVYEMEQMNDVIEDNQEHYDKDTDVAHFEIDTEHMDDHEDDHNEKINEGMEAAYEDYKEIGADKYLADGMQEEINKNKDAFKEFPEPDDDGNLGDDNDGDIEDGDDAPFDEDHGEHEMLEGHVDIDHDDGTFHEHHTDNTTTHNNASKEL